ncbi:hypothetical protein CR513_53557, partial [Mucuna pruriens]
MCALTEAKYEKVHNYKSSKEIDSKISMLIHQYKLFKMEDYETID